MVPLRAQGSLRAVLPSGPDFLRSFRFRLQTRTRDAKWQHLAQAPLLLARISFSLSAQLRHTLKDSTRGLAMSWSRVIFCAARKDSNSRRVTLYRSSVEP